MFYPDRNAPLPRPAQSRLIRALDATVAFATLESYGVVDARDIVPPVASPAARGAGLQGPVSAGRHRRASGLRQGARRPCGRPGAATAAGRRRHRAARARIERLGQ